MKWKSSYLSELKKSMKPGANAELITARKMFGGRNSIGLGTIAAYRMDPKQRMQRLHYVMACAKWGTLSDGDKEAYETWAEANQVTVFSSFLHSYLTDLKNALVLYLPMEAIVGSTVKDYSKYSNDGTEANTTLTKEGYIDNALEFNGTDSIVNCGSADSIDIGTSDFSIELLVNAEIKDYQELISKASPGFNTGFALYENASTAHLRCLIKDGVNGGAFTGTKKVFDGKWHHVITTFDKSGSCHMYVDGSSCGSFVISDVGDITVTQDLIIGRYTSNFADGLLDEIRIHKIALTSAEVLAIYRQEAKWHGDTA